MPKPRERAESKTAPPEARAAVGNVKVTSKSPARRKVQTDGMLSDNGCSPARRVPCSIVNDSGTLDASPSPIRPSRPSSRPLGAQTQMMARRVLARPASVRARGQSPRGGGAARPRESRHAPGRRLKADEETHHLVERGRRPRPLKSKALPNRAEQNLRLLRSAPVTRTCRARCRGAASPWPLRLGRASGRAGSWAGVAVPPMLEALIERKPKVRLAAPTRSPCGQASAAQARRRRLQALSVQRLRASP